MCACVRAYARSSERVYFPRVYVCARVSVRTRMQVRERGTMCFVLYNKHNVQTVVHITKSALINAKGILVFNFDRRYTNLRNRFPNLREINQTINTHRSSEIFILLVPKHFLKFIARLYDTLRRSNGRKCDVTLIKRNK